MVRISNSLIGILNFVTLLCSIPILGAGIWLSTRANTDCERFLEKPAITLGVLLLLVSLVGLIGACRHVSWLLWLYLFVMFVLILLLLVFTVFAFVVTNRGAGEVVSGKGFKEYRLGDYSHWLQKRMNNRKNWKKVMSCLQDSKVCRSMRENVNETVEQFSRENLSPIQSGCCKPPTSCNFTYVSPTNWTKTPVLNSADLDCNTWSNDPNSLCYGCDSCKAGVTANLKHDWKKVALVNIIFLIFLIIVYSVSCCAFRNDSRSPYPYRNYG